MHLSGLILSVVFVFLSQQALATPLDDYVNTPDPAFSWKRLQTYPTSTHTLFLLNMTSQRWFDGMSEPPR